MVGGSLVPVTSTSPAQCRTLCKIGTLLPMSTSYK